MVLPPTPKPSASKVNFKDILTDDELLEKEFNKIVQVIYKYYKSNAQEGRFDQHFKNLIKQVNELYKKEDINPPEYFNKENTPKWSESVAKELKKNPLGVLLTKENIYNRLTPKSYQVLVVYIFRFFQGIIESNYLEPYFEQIKPPTKYEEFVKQNYGRRGDYIPSVKKIMEEAEPIIKKIQKSYEKKEVTNFNLYDVIDNIQKIIRSELLSINNTITLTHDDDTYSAHINTIKAFIDGILDGKSPSNNDPYNIFNAIKSYYELFPLKLDDDEKKLLTQYIYLYLLGVIRADKFLSLFTEHVSGSNILRVFIVPGGAYF